jgi:capsid protein
MQVILHQNINIHLFDSRPAGIILGQDPNKKALKREGRRHHIRNERVSFNKIYRDNDNEDCFWRGGIRGVKVHISGEEIIASHNGY